MNANLSTAEVNQLLEQKREEMRRAREGRGNQMAVDETAMPLQIDLGNGSANAWVHQMLNKAAGGQNGRAPSSHAPDAADPPKIERGFQVPELDEFQLEHLEGVAARRMSHALSKAREWTHRARKERPLGAILAGPVGTGKTSLATRMMRDAFAYEVFEQSDDLGVTMELVARAMANARTEADRELLQSFYENQIESIRARGRTVVDGLRISAQELMELVKESPDLNPLDRMQCVIVDDIGSESMDYVKSEEKGAVRRLRYQRFVDWAWSHHRCVIMTTNIPLLGGDGFSEKLIGVLGEPAWDRMLIMTSEFMLNLEDVPSYRNHLAMQALNAARNRALESARI